MACTAAKRASRCCATAGCLGAARLYHFGSYHCSGGTGNGEVTSQEHTPTIDVRPFAGYVASMVFAGTYTDEGAESARGQMCHQ